MGFRTKLDFSDNRQVKQRIETTTILSGGTAFGVPYGDLPTGPNTSLSSITQTINNLTGNFSGNSGTTIFTWADTRMSLGDSSLSAITPSNSATTQNTGAIFTPDISSLFNIDGNTGYTHYTGVSYSVYASTFVDLGAGAYSGNLNSTILQILDTTGLDFSGRTIWNDVSGITRTNRLIITENPQVGYVWTCMDSEGMGEWQYNSSASTPTIWTAGTGANSAVLGGSDGIASGSTSVSEGRQTIAGGVRSHAEGDNTIASGQNSHAEGKETIADGKHTHAEGYGSIASSEAAHAEGYFTTASGDYSHAEGWGAIVLGDSAHAEGYYSLAIGLGSHAEGGDVFYGNSGGTASGRASHAEGAGTIASGDYSHAEGFYAIAGGNYSHAGGQYSTASGDTSFIHSNNSFIASGSINTAILGGQNNTITGTSISSGIFVGTGNTIANSSNYSAIIAGRNNTISGHTNAFIGGGSGNLIDFCLTLGGGNQNESVLGGQFNKIFTSYNSSIIGGSGNTIDNNGGYGGGLNVILGGKENNLNQGYNSSIVGGIYNILGDTLCHTDASSIIGGSGNINISNYSVIIGGVNNNIPSSLPNSVILGGSDITATTSNTTYTQNLNIDYQDGSYNSMLGINTSSPQYPLDLRGSNTSRIYYSSSSPIGGSFTLSAKTGLPLIGVNTNTSVFNQNGGISMGMRAWDDVTYPAYGKQGDTHIYSSKQANGLVIISSNGTGTEDYIDCYVGGDAGGGSSGVLAIHMHGTGATKGYVGFNTNLPSERLDVDGNGRFRSIGSSASAGALHYTASGTLTTNTSDERLKTNIVSITGALDKVNQLRGVTYNWSENPTGDTRIGFIAQEVNSVVPELTFTNPNSPESYMGVHYDNVTALLVEAVKELSSGLTTSNNIHLETQTILAEDNNIELNFNGTQQTAIGGGLSVLHAKGQDQSASLVTDSNGDFITNNDFKPQTLTIPLYTPSSTNDVVGSEGNITRDDNYMYIKTSTGWKRTNLENF